MRRNIGLIAFALVLPSISVAQYSNRFPDTPDNHWAYQAMADLKSVGILVGYPDTLGRGVHVRTRYEMAVATHACFVNFDTIVEQFEQSNDTIARFPGGNEAETKTASNLAVNIKQDFKTFRHSLDFVEKDLLVLTKAFSPELKKLGVDTTQMEGQERRDFQKIATFRFANLGEATRQFADVPESHWAAGAVKSLRAVGILKGYDSGRFLSDEN